MLNVLRSLIDACEAGCGCVFTSLVETRGSTPQKAGATMLVFADGSQVGTLGGGCVEAEVKRQALRSLAGGPTELLTFQLDSNYGWDDGLICGGRMRMLIDPVRPGAAADYYRPMLERLLAGKGFTEAVLLEPAAGHAAGDRYLFDQGGQVIAQTGSATPDCVTQNLRTLEERPRTYVAEGVSYLPTLARCRLIIVGAGHVGRKTAELAADVDFEVWVVDDRSDYCSAERFPTAARRLAGNIGDLLAPLETTGSDFGIIVTRGHHHDEEALLHLASKPFRYLGMIGSRRKIRMIFDDLRRGGIAAEVLDRVHAPLGFDIGSRTVPEIAISIVAELIACRNLSSAGGPVHPLRDAARAAAAAP